jgi:hypothetical protein
MQSEASQKRLVGGASPSMGTMPYYSNAEKMVLETIQCQLDPDIGHQCVIGRSGRVVSKTTRVGALPTSRAMVLKINKQSRLVVSEEIAGAAPVRTAI